MKVQDLGVVFLLAPPSALVFARVESRFDAHAALQPSSKVELRSRDVSGLLHLSWDALLRL